ncbi:MAG: cytochrome c oxidase accessory protein CcoG [Marinobacterium sp.]|nr:cytochrome c oxidase accessory protein CcoG [Marinobacterium sp.]
MQQIPVRTVSTTTAVGGKIHVRLTSGRFQNLRRIISGPLLLLYFALVWVQYEGQPWLLFDFASRRVTLFGTAMAWQDLSILAGLMIAGTCLLFFAAVGWGRVWCGFACPQSIWSWLFIRIETLTEGRAALRRREEGKPLQGQRLVRRVLKHLLWVLAALITALTFTGYFIPIRELFSQMANLEMGLTTLGWLITMTALTYLNAGLVREKICVHACPYARFQGVMFDDNTRTVSYDAARGEPRRGQADTSVRGDCVDCDLCVQVCPTGIDIRDGLQYECIDCGACIDACDAVMDKTGKPRGLIAFRSENQLAKQPSPLLRPRLLGYGAVLMITSLAVIYGFQDRSSLVLEVLRDRNTITWSNNRGELCNSYLVKVETVDRDMQGLSLSIDGPQGLYPVNTQPLTLSNGSTELTYALCNRNPDLPVRSEISFIVKAGETKVSKHSVFLLGVN